MILISRYYMEGGKPFKEDVGYIYAPDDTRSRSVPAPIHAILGGATNDYFWVIGNQFAFDLSGDTPDSFVSQTQPDSSVVSYPIYDDMNNYWDLYGHADRAGTTIITKVAYDAAVQADLDARALIDEKAKAQLRWSRSTCLVGAALLQNSIIETAWNVAVRLSDVTSLGISSVAFKLDGVLVTTEGVAPWDYFTSNGSCSFQGTFAVGTHTIDAIITFSNFGGGVYTQSSTFEAI